MKAIIFDMDGVIVDSEYTFHEAEYKVLKEAGVDKEIEFFYNYMGTTPTVIWKDAINKFGLPNTPEYYADKTSKYRKNIVKRDGVKAITGVEQVISFFIDKGFKMAVASSSPKVDINYNLTELQLIDNFEVVVSGEEMENSKPSPDIYLEAARQLGVTPEQCIGIEDSKNGIKAVKSAKMYCIAYSNPKYPTVGHDLADERVKSLNQISGSEIFKDDNIHE